mgnify:CR=1 FL=1
MELLYLITAENPEYFMIFVAVGWVIQRLD